MTKYGIVYTCVDPTDSVIRDIGKETGDRDLVHLGSDEESDTVATVSDSSSEPRWTRSRSPVSLPMSLITESVGSTQV